ncbi:DegV family protein [Pseudoflavonifractor sp. DSM 107456]|uniref:DegV family protein n=1 Tax=Pseudoflavonifractor gallinarum TaxID=2779352 RepID=A0ABR9RFV9_9FIRM|nr:DegV family protein [Pseudoflavonifractor gallinarum]MBE5057250.1 DegV family protein [Pseudoflavonifractor gallinarum]
MGNYCLSCCSAVDLTPERMKQRDLHYVCFRYTLDGTEYPDDMGVTMSSEELFDRMRKGAETKTSQVSVTEYIRHFEPLLREGKDILHVTLSSGLTGTYNSACLAKAELAEQYPERKIYIVDSLGASSGYGLLMETLADQRDAGKTIDELYAWAEENKLRLHHWFFSTDLSFYIRGGRISKAAGLVGTMLNICPLLNMDQEGHLTPREKIRGKKRVLNRIVEQMEQHAEGGTAYRGKCYLCHSLCEEDARAVAALVKERFPQMDGEVEIFPIGTTIGSHTGPGTVALFFWGDQRDN